MFKYAMISISTLGLFTAAPTLAKAEISKAPTPLTVVSKEKTPVLANICGNGIVEEGEACDGGSNCTADCEGGMYNADAPNQNSPLHSQDSIPEVQVADKPAYGPVNSGQGPAHELAPVDKPEFGPLPIPAECGNGKMEAGETCDDGNTITGDGCDGVCRVEDANDAQPLADRTRPGSRGEDSQVGFGGTALMSGSGCSLQSFSPKASVGTALAGLMLLALPLLRFGFSRRS